MDKLGSAISFSCKNSFGLINGSKCSRLQTRWNPGFDVEVLRASCYCERDAVDQAVDIAVLWVDSRIHCAVQLGMEQIEQIPYKSLSCLFLFPSFSIFFHLFPYCTVDHLALWSQASRHLLWQYGRLPCFFDHKHWGYFQRYARAKDSSFPLTLPCHFQKFECLVYRLYI